jgi:hypothetical protein
MVEGMHNLPCQLVDHHRHTKEWTGGVAVKSPLVCSGLCTCHKVGSLIPSQCGYLGFEALKDRGLSHGYLW